MKNTLDAALVKYTQLDIPEFADTEEEIDEPTWIVSENETDESYPGLGLRQHDFLYVGEGCNRMSLVKDGKVMWTFCAGKGWEYDDVWMMTNGNILFSRMYWAAEITPDKKYVWRYDVPEGCELHTLQPIGLDKIMFVENRAPFPRVVIVNIVSGEIEYEHEIPYDLTASVHGQFRRFRYTAQNTFLAACLSMNQVIEYDMDFNVIWSYNIGKPWAAVRLKNGNTLITGEAEGVQREVNSKGETVWEIFLKDLPEEFHSLSTQSCVRLDNGNTIICVRGNFGNAPQLVEVTPQKEIVWVINDWKNFGPATAVQILDGEGIPEKPGDCQR